MSFGPRPVGGVSVVVPCFNHGMFLCECLESIHRQGLAAAEIIVVDDGSTDGHTVAVLDELESDERVIVLRERNRGPSAARNAGILHASGSAVLPVDADDWLEPYAIEALVEELRSAPPEVGWIYIHLQFFGNRNDLAVQPVFNPYLLLQSNYCSTTALIDRRMLDAGIRYREEIQLGHEDWDFYLQALQKGFIGQLCQRPVLHVRKSGFTRSDIVSHRFGSFQPEVARMNPGLFDPVRVLALKREWAPALSIVFPRSGPAGRVQPQEVEDLLVAQTCQDFQIVDAASDGSTSTEEILSHASLLATIERAKGKYVLVWLAGGSGPIADPAFVEKGLRLIENAHTLNGLVLIAQRPADDAPDWAPAANRSPQSGPVPILGVLVRTLAVTEASRWFRVDDDAHPAGGLAALLEASVTGSVEWRSFRATADIASSLPSIPTVSQRTPSTEPAEDISEPERLTEQSTVVEVGSRMIQSPLWPAALATRMGPVELAAQETGGPLKTAWQPEYTALVWLAEEPVNGEFHLVAEGSEPALTGLRFDSIIGRLYTRDFPGTAPLFRVSDPMRQQSSVCFSASCQHGPRSQVSLLGHFSTAPLPGMINLLATVHQRLQTTLGGAGLLRTHCEGWSAFVEPETLPPLGIDELLDAAATGAETWPIYPLGRDGPDGGRYTLHPDGPIGPGGWVDGHGNLGSLFASPGRYTRPLHLLTHELQARHFYASAPDAGVDLGYIPAGLLGHLLARPVVGTAPLYRFHSRRGLSHRLSLEPSTSDDWTIDGPVGYVVAPSRDRVLLRRWRHKTDLAWRYTSDSGTPVCPGEEWSFETTLGAAWAAGVRAAGLLPFVELFHSASGRWAYSVRPQEFEDMGYRKRQILCAVRTTPGPGTIALRRSYSPEREGHLYGVASQERVADGFVPEGAIAFLQPAVPPRRALTGEPDVAVATLQEIVDGAPGGTTLAVGPQPGASPVYGCTRPDAPTWFGTDHVLAAAAGYELDDVAGYLVDAAGGPDKELGLDGPPLSCRWQLPQRFSPGLGREMAGLQRRLAAVRAEWVRRISSSPAGQAPPGPVATGQDHPSSQS